MSPIVRKLAIGELRRLEDLVTETLEGAEPSFSILGSRLLFGHSKMDLVAMDGRRSLVLIALAFTADDATLLRMIDAYSWCLEYPDSVRQLYPAMRIHSDAPPRLVMVGERLPDTFLRKVRLLKLAEFSCYEFRYVEIDGEPAFYLDIVDLSRRPSRGAAGETSAEAPDAPSGVRAAAPPRPVMVPRVPPTRTEPPPRVDPVPPPSPPRVPVNVRPEPPARAEAPPRPEPPRRAEPAMPRLGTSGSEPVMPDEAISSNGDELEDEVRRPADRPARAPAAKSEASPRREEPSAPRREEVPPRREEPVARREEPAARREEAAPRREEPPARREEAPVRRDRVREADRGTRVDRAAVLDGLYQPRKADPERRRSEAAPTATDEAKVRCVRDYLQRELPSCSVYDFFDLERGAHAFHLQDSHGHFTHLAYVAADFLTERSEREIQRVLEQQRVAQALRQMGSAGILVTSEGVTADIH